MLSYIYRITREFEQQHGIQPNLLYLNATHAQHLKTGFAENYSYQCIIDFLQMDLVISEEVVHPRVSWTQASQRMAV